MVATQYLEYIASVSKCNTKINLYVPVEFPYVPGGQGWGVWLPVTQ